MAKVSVILVIYEGRRYIKRVFDAVMNQTYPDVEVIAVINRSTDGGLAEIQQHYPQVKIINPGRNLGFAEGNNAGILASTGEFIQLVNQDLILEPAYIEEMLKAFADPHVAAATGKLLRYDFETDQKNKIIDSTGVIMSAAGRARDRGQMQIDAGQFDGQPDVFAVSGAAPMYRRTALEKVRYRQEYFDQDFFMYWEDVDLSWRLNRAGFKNVYVPTAIGYHGRTAGQSAGGYLHLFKFIRHHSKLSRQIRRWNYKNHILMYLKNTPRISLSFILREVAMLGYILIFEPTTLGVVPELFRQMKTLKAKRQIN
jgi:GT2 family glycosyltransferase